MKRQVFYCLFIAVITLYALIVQQNQLTELQLHLPVLEKEVRSLREKNNQLRFEIAQFENPKRLIGLLDADYKKLTFINAQEVTVIPCPAAPE